LSAITVRILSVPNIGCQKTIGASSSPNSGQKDLEKNEKLSVMVELGKRASFVKCLAGLAKLIN